MAHTQGRQAWPLVVWFFQCFFLNNIWTSLKYFSDKAKLLLKFIENFRILSFLKMWPIWNTISNRRKLPKLSLDLYDLTFIIPIAGLWKMWIFYCIKTQIERSHTGQTWGWKAQKMSLLWLQKWTEAENSFSHWHQASWKWAEKFLLWQMPNGFYLPTNLHPSYEIQM